MKKCDWCTYSYLENGKLQCPYLTCQLTQSKLFEIIKFVKEIEGKK